MSPSGCLRMRREAGAVLLTALVVMLAVLMLGVAAARAAAHAEKSARYERDRHIALAGAEAALVDAGRDIEGSTGSASARAALFAAGAALFPEGCGSGPDDLGLCRAQPQGATPAWQTADIAGASAVAYGNFTGARMATGAGTLPARAPRYIIEFIPVTGAAAASGSLYRITAMGFGAREGTRVVLQAFYRKAVVAAPPGGDGRAAGTPGTDGAPPAEPPGAASPTGPAPAVLPAGRIAWREVPNWADLHLAAITNPAGGGR